MFQLIKQDKMFERKDEVTYCTRLPWQFKDEVAIYEKDISNDSEEPRNWPVQQ